MVEVSYPGVYIQEVPSGVHTIMGVSTSIGAFIGRTMTGPTETAVRCLSWADYERTFGDAHPKNRLAQSVRQFFANGGTDCYVVRLAPGAEKAGVTLCNASSAPVLIAKAKSKGKWGNNIRLQVDYNTTNPDETFNLHVLLADDGTVVSKESFTSLSMDKNSPRFAPDFVTQSSTLITLEEPTGGIPTPTQPAGYTESRRPLNTVTIDDAYNGLKTKLTEWLNPVDHTKKKNSFRIIINDGKPKDIVLTEDISAQPDTNTILTGLTEQINKGLGGYPKVKCEFEPFDGELSHLRIISDIGDKKSVRIQRASANDLAGALMLGVEQGGVELVVGQENRPVPTALYYDGEFADLAIVQQSTALKLKISGSEIDLSTTNFVTTVDADPWYRDGSTTSVNDGNDGVRQKLAMIVKAVNNDAKLPFRAELWGYHIAFIQKKGMPNTSLVFDPAASWNANVIDGFVSNVHQYPVGNPGSSLYANGYVLGIDETIGRTIMPEDYSGNEIDQTGMHALDSVDIFNLMVIPEDEDIGEDQRTQIYSECSNYCKDKRAFLIMDAPKSWINATTIRPAADQNMINQFRAQVVKEYSAVFYPDIQYVDSGIKKTMGPSGMIAGLFARTDSTRGVWKAPAGIDATLAGLIDMQVNLTDRENGVYNKLGVNCLRIFPNGFVNWGARTMAGFDDNSNTDWKYIPIRRLALYIEESLFRGTKWVVFEPNDEPLWASIRLNIGAFMMSLFRQGAFQGSTPEKAFYVKCNKETTTQDDRNRGIVNIEIGFAPLKPAEFVVIKIQQIAGEL